MENFYREFFERYFIEVKNPVLSYHSEFRQKITIGQKFIYYYELILDKMTRILSKNKYVSLLLYNNNYFLNNLHLFEETYFNLNDTYSQEKYLEYIIFKSLRLFFHNLLQGR